MLFQHCHWDLTHQVLFLYILFSHHMKLRDQPWKMLILWYRTNIRSCKFSEKVSLMLENPFLVPSICRLNHISLCFIQISTKSPANGLFPSGKAMFFFEVILGVLGRSVNFNITKISIETARVSRLSVSCDHCVTKILNVKICVFLNLYSVHAARMLDLSLEIILSLPTWGTKQLYNSKGFSFILEQV